MSYTKKHNEWNDLKKIIDWLNISLTVKQQEIWWAMLGTNIGIEIDGKGIDFLRPVIVIQIFNQQHLWVVPLAHVERIYSHVHIRVEHVQLDSGTYAIINQFQTMSSKRLVKQIGILNEEQFLSVTNSISRLLRIKQKQTRPDSKIES